MQGSESAADFLHRNDKLGTRSLGVGAGVILLIVFLGCAGLSQDRREIVERADGTTAQDGRVSVPDGKTVDVYYPIPYNSRPNLETHDTFEECLVVEQRSDGFRVRNPSPFARTVTWSARGVVVPISTPAPVTPTTGLPPEPIPVSAPGNGESPVASPR